MKKTSTQALAIKTSVKAGSGCAGNAVTVASGNAGNAGQKVA